MVGVQWSEGLKISVIAAMGLGKRFRGYGNI